jgi:hypothetical protein
MIRKTLFLSLALAATAGVAGAQRNSRGYPIEFGIDGGIAFVFSDPTVTVLSLPAQDFRVGFILNNTWEVEPRFGLNSISSNGNHVTTYEAALGVLWHLRKNPTGKGAYLRPFLGLTGVSTDAGSDSNGLIGIGLGAKLPFGDRRLATRLEANLASGLGDGSNAQLGLLFGLSFFH